MRALLALVLLSLAAAQQPTVDFVKQVAPILQQRCVECHGEKLQKGDLRLDRKEHLFAAAEADWPVKPGKPDDSDLLRRVQLPAGDEDVMPNKGELLRKEQIDTLRAWIAAGAEWPPAGDEYFAKAAAEAVVKRIDFGIAAPDAAVQARIDAALLALQQRGVVAQGVAQDTPAVDVNCSLLGPAFGDQDLLLLAGLEPVLVWLNLARTKVTDDGLRQLAGMAQLRRLNLANTAIGDGGLAQLGALPRLEVLNVYGSKVGDQGLAALSAMPALQKVYAFSTAVTAAGAAAAIAAAAAASPTRPLAIDRGEYVDERLAAAAAEIAAREAAKKPVNDTCPLTGKPVVADTAIDHEGLRIAFCCNDCKKQFTDAPAKWADKVAEYKKLAAAKKPVNDTCPLTGKPVVADTAIEHEGLRIAFCCNDCKKQFTDAPAKWADKVAEYKKAAAASEPTKEPAKEAAKEPAKEPAKQQQP